MNKIHLKLLVAVLWLILGLSAGFTLIDGYLERVFAFDELADVRPKSPDKVRVCVWNLRNYGVSKRIENGRWREHPKPELERNAIRAVIEKINPDVLLLCEVADKAWLMELRSSLHARGQSFKYWTIGENPAPMRVAFLSKIMPQKNIDRSFVLFQFDGGRRSSPRGTVGAQFVSNKVKWRAEVRHLKSKYGAKKGDNLFIDFREAEAAALLSGNSAKIPTIIGGDFNDVPEALEKVFAARGFFALEQGDSHDSPNTYFWARKKLWFPYDRFYANAKMKPFISSRAKIFESENYSCSDHRPVYVDLDFSQKKN